MRQSCLQGQSGVRCGGEREREEGGGEGEKETLRELCKLGGTWTEAYRER